MKSRKKEEIFLLLLLLNFLVKSNCNKSNQRKLQTLGDSNYIEINIFDSEFQTDNCWYTKIRTKISQLTVDYGNNIDLPGSFTIPEGKSVKIIFSEKLTDLSYFLSYNQDLPDIPLDCQISDHFINHIVQIDLSNLDVSEVTTMEGMFKGWNKLTRMFFPQEETTSLLTNTNGMFSGCNSLKNFDLSKLNTESVSDMGYMFSGCSLMETISISNLDMSSVTNMEYIFYGCTSLKSIDLRYKDMPVLTNIEHMFDSCTSLESVIMYNFNAENLINMNSLFLNCISLTSIDLTFFTTSNVENMDSLFENCNKLQILDLEYFQTTRVTSMDNIFADCTSLAKLFIPNFMMEQLMTSNNAFKNVNNLKYLDIQNMKYNNNEEYNDNTCVIHDCNLPLNYDNEKALIVCQNNKFITNEKILEICCEFNIFNEKCDSYNYVIMYFNTNILYENGFINEYRDSIAFIIYNDIMFSPNSELNILANTPVEIHFNYDSTSLEKCFSAEVDNNMINLISIDFSSFSTYSINMASMFYGCTSLEELSLPFFTLDVENMDYMFYNCNSLKVLDISNFIFSPSVSTEQMFYGLDNLKFINLFEVVDYGPLSLSEINTLDKDFFICQASEIITNPKALNCCEYIIDENICYGNATINKNITKEIENLYNEIISNIMDENFKLIQNDFYNLQFSKYNTQLKNTLVSSVNLGECEPKLKQQESLTESEQFLMIKLDLINTTVNAKYVQYDIFNPRTYSKVNLDICKNISIQIKVPLVLNESTLALIFNLQDEGYNIFDLEDDFYTDVCSPYTAQNGADIVLSSRKTLIYDSMKDIYFCQTGCEFINYDTKTNLSNCNCKVQTGGIINDIFQISFDKTKFVDSFYSTLYNSNFRVLNCIKLLFSPKGIKKNYGFYSQTFLLGTFIGFIIMHIIVGQKKIINIIDNIIKLRVNKETQNISKDKKSDISLKEEKENPPKKMKKIKFDKNQTNENHNINLNDGKITIKSKGSKKSNKKMNSKINNYINEVIYTKDELNKVTNTLANENDNNIDNNNEVEKKIKEKFKDLIDEEINNLDYETALIIDKRTFWQYYISLLKRDHLIIFTFITRDDFNLHQIKILLFIITFSLYFSINAFFFHDDTMNTIYEDDASFNFIFQIPQILYSSIISFIINYILNKLSISENQILDLKNEEELPKFKQKSNTIKKNLKIKLIIFLALSSFLMLFSWYFISCFCAVYQNTQLILIEDTLISFLTAMIYPFILDLLPGIFRIPSLRTPKKDQKYNYKISKILSLL